MTTTCIFDVETGPLPWEVLEQFFELPAGPGEFNPAAVKIGNMTDLTKIDTKTKTARTAHDKAIAGHAAKVEIAKAEFIGNAAKSAITGQALAIGMHVLGEDPFVLGSGQTEAGLIDAFWANVDKISSEHGRMIGFNIFGFDLPFLARRSWAVGVPVSAGLFNQRTKWRPCFVDLAEIYRLGKYGDYISLDRLAAHLGCEQKSGSGAEFAEKWANDREAAIEYLKQDLVVTRQVAEKLGVI